MGTEETPIDLVKDGGARIWAALDAELAAGRIGEDEWFARSTGVIEAHYLAGDNPRAQSGHSGDDVRWEQARRPLLAAVDRDGDFLDVGCASGYLMETLQRWAAEDGIALEPNGLEVSARLADLARRRLPEWAGRIWVGNVLHWVPPRRFDYIRTGLEYVPVGRRGELVGRLLGYTRRLIIGIRNEEVGRHETEEELRACGFAVSGRVEAPHSDPRVVRRAVWIDS